MIKLLDIIEEIKNNIKTYYHVTDSKNLKNIMKQGLIPIKKSRGYFVDLPENSGIYLFNSFTDAQNEVTNYFGDEFSDKIALLEINLPLDWKLVKDTELDCASISEIPIPPKYIKIISEDW